MDEHVDILEERYGESLVHDFRDVDEERAKARELGLVRCTPINPDKYPRMQRLWEHIQTQDYAFDDFSRGSIETFALSLLDKGSLHFEVDDRGYIVVRNLLYSDNPNIHFCVWDRSMQMREIIACGQEIIDFLFRRLKVARVSAWIPTYNRQATRFATLLGFRYEGEQRNAILFHEKHYNVQMYGLLRSEWENKRR